MDVECDPPAWELILVTQPLHHLPIHHIRVPLLLSEGEHGLVPYLCRWVVCIGEVEEDQDIWMENWSHPLEQRRQLKLSTIRHGSALRPLLSSVLFVEWRFTYLRPR